MGEEIKTEFKVEGEPAFPIENKENDNSSESSTEKTNGDQTQSDDGEQKSNEKKDDTKENFADHPRWKERETDWTRRFNDQESRHTQEIEQIRKDIESKFDRKREALDTDVPKWFGGDAEAWKQYQVHEESRLNQLEQNMIKKAEEKADKEQKAVDEATTYLNNTIVEIENDKKINPDGQKIDKNKLLKFVLDNELVDTKGRWNYRAGFLLMKSNVNSVKKDIIDEKKKIAAASTGNDKGETKTPSYMTSDDFKKPGARPW